MSNYQAIVAKIDLVFPIAGADKIQIGKVLGETVVISKESQVGDIGVFFCSGTQLSARYAYINNLYRDSTKNSNGLKAGFFEDSLRVRAQPFLKIKSEAYFAPLDSLSFAGDITTLKVGDKFEEWNGVEICTKYISQETKRAMGNSGTKAKKLNINPFFAKHVDTAQFNHNLHEIKIGDLISIQSKRHGTSFRVGYTKCVKALTGWKAFIQKFLPIFKTEGYEYVVGTRNVVLDNPTKEGFHGSEAYRFEVAQTLGQYLTKGMSLYGEIVGFVNGKSIMPAHNISTLKDKEYTKKYGDKIVYKYGCLEGQYKFHIYRITLTTDDGTTIDFTQPQLVEWCNQRGLEPSRDLVPPFIYKGDEGALKALVADLTERPDMLTEDYHDGSHVSEGVIIRCDNGKTTPVFLKSKSYAFKVMEGICDVPDAEDIA